MKKTIIAGIIAGIIAVSLLAPSVTLAYGGGGIPSLIGVTNGAPVKSFDYRATTDEKMLELYHKLLTLKIKVLRLQLELKKVWHIG